MFINSKHKFLIIVISLIIIFCGILLFSKSISNNGNDSWITLNSENGITLEYPDKIGDKYIHDFDWPPQIRIIDESFSCSEAGKETERAGETTKEIINGKTYCITKITEGAAGSIYTQYVYTRGVGNRTAILTFSIREVQCVNYSEPERNLCEKEKEEFELDNIISKIMDTIK